MSNLSDFVILPPAMGAPVEIKEEGSQVTASVSSINFMGDNVSVTPAGQGVNVTVTGGGGGGGGIKGDWDVTPIVTPPAVSQLTSGATYNPLTSVLTSADMSSSINIIDGAVVTFQGAEAFDNTFNKFVSMNLGVTHDPNVFAIAGFIDAALTPAEIRQAIESALLNNTAGLPAGFNVGAWIQFFSLAGGVNLQTYTWNGTSLNASSASLDNVPSALITILLNKWDNAGDQTMVAVGTESANGNIDIDVLSAEALTAESEITVGIGELSVTLQAFYAVFSVGNFGPYTHIIGPFSGEFAQNSVLPAVSVPALSNFDNIHTPTSQAVFDSYFTAPYIGLSSTTQAEFPPSTEVNDQYRIVGTGSPYNLSVVTDDVVLVDNIGLGTEAFRISAFQSGGSVPASLVSYDNIASGMAATNLQAAVDELDARVAEEVPYSNVSSGLVATNVQTAIDEVNAKVPKAFKDGGTIIGTFFTYEAQANTSYRIDPNLNNWGTNINLPASPSTNDKIEFWVTSKVFPNPIQIFATGSLQVWDGYNLTWGVSLGSMYPDPEQSHLIFVFDGEKWFLENHFESIKTIGITATGAQNSASAAADAANNAQGLAYAAQNTANSAQSTANSAQSTANSVTINFSNHLLDTEDAHDASSISYVNTASGLTAIQVQAAIDEIEGRLGDIEAVQPPAVQSGGVWYINSSTIANASPAEGPALVTVESYWGVGTRTYTKPVIVRGKILDTSFSSLQDPSIYARVGTSTPDITANYLRGAVHLNACRVVTNVIYRDTSTSPFNTVSTFHNNFGDDVILLNDANGVGQAVISLKGNPLATSHYAQVTFGDNCRLYNGPYGESGYPPVELIDCSIIIYPGRNFKVDANTFRGTGNVTIYVRTAGERADISTNQPNLTGTFTVLVSEYLETTVYFKPTSNFGSYGPLNPGTVVLADVSDAGYTGAGSLWILPASPLVGDTYQIRDVTGGFAGKPVDVSRNGQNINSVAANVTLSTNYGWTTFVFTGDPTIGWIYKTV